jgi:hypothetical protein
MTPRAIVRSQAGYTMGEMLVVAVIGPTWQGSSRCS